MTESKKPTTVDEIMALADKAAQAEVEYQQALSIDVGVRQAGMASGEADIALRAAVGALVADRDAKASQINALIVEVRALLKTLEKVEAERDALLRWKSTHAPRIEALEGLLQHEQIEAAKGKEAIATLASEREANAILTAEVEALRTEIERMSGITHLEQINDGLIEENETLRAALKDAGLFLHHCWCDVQMNEYSWEKLNVTMAAIDAAMREQSNG